MCHPRRAVRFFCVSVSVCVFCAYDITYVSGAIKQRLMHSVYGGKYGAQSATHTRIPHMGAFVWCVCVLHRHVANGIGHQTPHM